jgi:hypothetical protein
LDKHSLGRPPQRLDCSATNNLRLLSLFDPAMYRNQKLASVPWTVSESVRRAILKIPKLAQFHQLASSMDFRLMPNEHGVPTAAHEDCFEQQDTDEYTKSAGSRVCGGGGKGPQMKTAVTIADAVAIGGGSD